MKGYRYEVWCHPPASMNNKRGRYEDFHYTFMNIYKFIFLFRIGYSDFATFFSIYLRNIILNQKKNSKGIFLYCELFLP